MRDRSFVRAVVLALLFAAAAPLLSACNTVAGAGQDVSATGTAVSRGAQDVRRAM
jgi:predicted small secreted protein